MAIVLNPDAGVTTPSPVTLEGSTSGTVTLAAPAVAGSTVITFPATTGTVAITSELEQIGVGQTWQDVLSSRAAGTTYTNSTGKPIQVAIRVSVNSVYTFSLSVGGVVVGSVRNDNGSTVIGQLTAIVPDGNTYILTASGGGTGTLGNWAELR